MPTAPSRNLGDWLGQAPVALFAPGNAPARTWRAALPIVRELFSCYSAFVQKFRGACDERIVYSR